MITLDGLMIAVESMVSNPLTLGLYVNEPDGEVVRRTDLEEPNNYETLTIQPGEWTLDPGKLRATAVRKTFKFTSKAGKVAGYFIAKGDRIISYEPFMDPIPVNTNEDLIHVRPRLKATRPRAI